MASGFSFDQCVAEARRSFAHRKAWNLGAEYDRLTAIPVDPAASRRIAALAVRIAADSAAPTRVRNAAKGAPDAHPIVALLLIVGAARFAGYTVPRLPRQHASTAERRHPLTVPRRTGSRSRTRRPSRSRRSSTAPSDDPAPPDPPGARSADRIGGRS